MLLKVILKSGLGRRFPGLARVMTMLALLLAMPSAAQAQSATTTYKVTLKEGTKDADNWKAKAGTGDLKALPLEGVAEGEKVTLQYEGRKRVMSVRATKKAAAWDGDLSKLTGSEPEGFATATDGMTITGKLADGVNVKVTIADRATVTLSNATIEGTNVEVTAYYHAGITCLGDATIVLSGTNSVKGFYEDYPGIYVPEKKTLTISGDGSLEAKSNGCGCGIGGGGIPCGSITIEGGSITATGGNRAAGIGGGKEASCGDIRIKGGTVEATGGPLAAGIGSGRGGEASCGDISIEGGSITAKGGDYAAGIGSGNSDESSCGDILITGGTVEAEGGVGAAGIGGGYDATCLDITITSGVTKVTATAGNLAPNSIGKGYGDNAKCGAVTVGCTLGTDGKPEAGSGMVYNDGIATSPFTYWGVVVPLTMEALTNGKIKVVVDENIVENKVKTAGMQYAVNDGDKKTIKTTTEIDVEKGYRVTFYGNYTFTDCYRGTKISGGDAEVMVYGNIMSLVDETGFASANALSQEYAFTELFYQNTKLKDASGLLLPATKLAPRCYYCMFSGCSELTAAPELPATELVKWCYRMMFYKCKNLASVTSLATSGFETEKCLYDWLNGAGSGVTGTKTFTAVSGINWPAGESGIPDGWSRVDVGN